MLPVGGDGYKKGDSSGCKRELSLEIHTGQFDAVSVTSPPQWVATTSHE